MTRVSVATQDSIIEPLHGAIKLKLELSRISLGKFISCFHGAHLGDPSLKRLKAGVIGRKIWIILQGLLHVAQSGKEFVNIADVECKDVHGCDELRRDVEDSLGQVPVRLFAFVVRGTGLEQTLG